jgi:hypothetical protein
MDFDELDLNSTALEDEHHEEDDEALFVRSRKTKPPKHSFFPSN